jgi:hypothetical protein
VSDYPFSVPFASIENQNPGLWRGFCASAPTNDCINKAITEAGNAIGDNKVQLGAALAESVKTYNMIAERSIQLWELYRAVKHGTAWAEISRRYGFNRDRARYFRDKKQNFRRSRDLAGLWLELQYGWRPLLSDIHDGYEFLARPEKKTQLSFLRGEGSGTLTYDLDVATGGTTGNGKVSVRARASILAALRSEVLHSANQGGLINPLQVAWELVPFSFVVDWFMPVGNVLQNFTDYAGLTFLTGSVTQIVEGEMDFTATSYESLDSRGSFKSISGGASVSSFTMDRTVMAGFPVGRFYSDMSPINKERAANALALFRSVAFSR